MFLTLLQSRSAPPPPPVIGGGGPGTATGSRKSRTGWVRERADFEASLLRFDPEHQAALRRISKTLTDSEQPQANRIARKLIDFDGDLKQIESLQKELAKLEVLQSNRISTAQIDADLKMAARELSEILLDEEDSIAALMAVDEFESQAVFSVLGFTLH